MRLKDARYNLNDVYVRPGELFFYQSVIENLLNSRFAYGLLKTQFNPQEAIAGWINKLLPRTFELKPDNPVVVGVNTAVISDTLQIDPTWSTSGNLNIKQTVTAQIVGSARRIELRRAVAEIERRSWVDRSLPILPAICRRAM